ncbi:aspartate/glutamate racemase family protein [Amycolatopsis sp. 195334CR]|uniref:aspartate/glutamate racemase family protein n=1 Tax=Amycolatopsis sp. 195334CR TaxID=2814588 RepID=UPI001A8E53B8|nr:aspartate/glutamate racemase family protein [Amycolatopsis sp. 195334CR]MBN6039849.1 aspartate/glutamate racemase family protein [Amycolatopsis sp. 195334CR]
MLGILGGMGPYASAEFLRTVYETADERHGPSAEQELPHCLLDSDPAFPDRTEAILAGRDQEFTARLRHRLQSLADQGATRIVLTCVTAHHFTRWLGPELRDRLISLVEVVLDDLEVGGDGPFLMLATSGTRAAKVFESNPRWPAVAHRVLLPPAGTQDEIHRLLYRLKREPVSTALAGAVEELVVQYGCRGVIAGCTEVHLLTRWWQARGGGPLVVDPLRSIANDLPKLLEA